MRFKSPLERGTLIRRYKRFLADVVLTDGTETTIHVPNPGAMLGLTGPGLPVWMSRSPDPKRKLPLTLEMVELPDAGLVGVNTMNPNRIGEAAIAEDRIAELTGYPILRREVRYDQNSRIDILLQGDADGLTRPSAWVEIKNVHFSRSPGLRVPGLQDRAGGQTPQGAGAGGRRGRPGRHAVHRPAHGLHGLHHRGRHRQGLRTRIARGRLTRG